MVQKDNILQELNELGSRLGNTVVKNPYTVPSGYFDNLLIDTLKRIKADEAIKVSEELDHLTTHTSLLSRQNPYTVPAGYFENLAENTLLLLRGKIDYQTPKEELEMLSPLLSGLKKESPYSVPAGYFETLAKEEKTVSKVVSISRRSWFRYAAAAVVAAFIVTAGFIYFSGEKTPGGKALAKFTRDVKNMDETQKDNLIDFIDAGMSGKETVKITTDKTNEVKDLLRGVSDQELKDFEEQTEDIQDVLMTN